MALSHVLINFNGAKLVDHKVKNYVFFFHTGVKYLYYNILQLYWIYDKKDSMHYLTN